MGLPLLGPRPQPDLLPEELETSFSKSNREPILVQGHGRPEERLVQKVKRNHVAFLNDVDEQEVDHKLELVHVEKLRF